jgi:adenylyl- and sulfurtransferase ThiI
VDIGRQVARDRFQLNKKVEKAEVEVEVEVEEKYFFVQDNIGLGS